MERVNMGTSPLATTGPFDVSTYETDRVLSVEYFAKNGFSLRMTLVRLNDAEVLVYSPVRALASRDFQPWLGTSVVRYVLSPNYFHHRGFDPWRASHPDATFLASPAAVSRIRSKVECEVEVLDPSSLSARELEVIVPPGTRTGECWLKIGGDESTWIVGDAFFSMPTTPPGLFGLVCKLTGTTPGLRIGHTYVTLALEDKRAYGRWLLERIESDAPRTLITCHGDVLRSATLPARLTELAKTRLGV